MGKRNREVRLFTGGINADSTPQLIGVGELINSLNVTAFSPYTQQEGSLRSLYAPSLVGVLNSILETDGGNHTLLNYYADERNNLLFFFFWSSLGLHKIISLDSNAITATVVLKDDYVVGGLGWASDSYMSIDMFGDLLIFTDNINPIRYINYTKTYTTGSLTQGMIQFGQSGYAAPLSCSRFTDTSVTTFTVQKGGFQFLYRIQNEEGFTSVLSVYSQTIPPVRQSDIDSDPSGNAGNSVNCSLNFEIKIPSNWERIDYIVRNLFDKDNSFLVFKTFYSNNSVDAAQVAAHNSGTTPLTSRFTGFTLETIPSDDIARYFQLQPIKSKFVDVNQNRLICANNLLGYDGNTTIPTNLSIAPNTITIDGLSGQLHKVYLVCAKNYVLDDLDFPIYAGLFVSFNSKVYSLPYDYSRLRFNGLTTFNCDTKYEPFPYNPPQVIPLTELIEINGVLEGAFASVPDVFSFIDTFCNSVNNGINIASDVSRLLARLVWSVHGFGDLINASGTATSGDWRVPPYVPVTPSPPIGYIGLGRFYMYDGNIDEIFVTDTPSVDNERSFLPLSNYNIGVQFYDEQLRTSGNFFIQKIRTPEYDPINRQLNDSLAFNISGAAVSNGAPDWAKYFGVTMSKNDTCANFINFIPNCIKVARKDDLGVISVFSDWSNDFKNEALHSLAVPLDSLSEYNKGYDFTEGDAITLSFAGGYPPSSYTIPFTYTGSIIGLQDGHLLVAPPTDRRLNTITSYLSSQYKQVATPTYDPVIGAAKCNFIQYPGNIYSRQPLCYATIYIQPQKNANGYEVAAFGVCEDLGSGNQISKFYSGTSTSLSFTVQGDCYAQLRSGRTGSFIGISNTSNESTISNNWLDNTGRVAPVDTVGQAELVNEVRWTNIGLLNSNKNNLCNFDSADYKLIDISAGSINMLYSNFGDGSRSNTLLVICTSNGYALPLGQSVIRSTTGVETLTQSDKFVDNVNELEGRPSTESPRSFASYKGNVFWVDVAKRGIMQFSGGQVRKISDIKTKRVFEQILQKSYNSGQFDVLGGVNPLSMEYIVTFPDDNPLDKPDLITTDIEFPFDYFYEKQYSWVFNFNPETTGWSSIFQTGRRYLNLNNVVFSWSNSLDKLYAEYQRSDSNPEFDGLAAFAFNAEYPLVKSPLSLNLDATRKPDETYVYTTTNTRNDGSLVGAYTEMVAGVSDWIYREGQWQASILRNRLSNNAVTAPQFNASGISGARLQGKVLLVVMKWNKTGGDFAVTSCAMLYES